MRFSRVASFCAFLILIISSSLTSSAQVCNLSQIPSNLRNGLVAYYPFCGNANDLSGNGNNGTVTGATLTTDRFGTANRAYSFNGLNNYINIPNSSTISIQNNFSVSVWFLMDGGGCNPRIFEINQNINSCGGYVFAVNGTSNTSRTIHAANFGSCTAGIGFNSTQPIPALQWNHLVMSVDGSAGVGRLYLNGQLIQTVNGVQIPTFSYNGNPLTIGNINSGRCDWWGGKIDDVFFYNRALNSCEVQQLYTATSSAIPTAGTFSFNPIVDTTRVCGTTTILDAGSGYSSYLWNTGATTQTISPTVNGKYFVTVTNSSGCTASDTTNLILRGRLINESNLTACNFSNYQLTAKRNRGPLKYIGTYQGHDYFIDTISRKWSLARDTARINGSELWIINNLQENTHVYNNFLPFNANNNASYWAGLYQDLGASNFSEPGGGWKWLDGTSMTFSNWYTNEPNNTWAQGVAENFMHIKWSSMYFDKWNDVIEDLPAAGYLSYGISESNTPTYLWSTGATTSSITVSPTQTTTYYLTVTENGASCTDSVRLTVTGIQFSPLQDTTRICGTTTTLDAGAGFTTYNWNTGATTQTITPSVGGFYKVTVTNSAGCTTSDSTTLSLVKANILNNDTTICLGNSIRLSIDSLFPGRTSCTTSQLPEGLRTGLLAYYPFCGNANNAMGTGNNGTVYNATLTTDRFGVANSAYSFNGTNAYIDFGSNTSIGPTTTNPVSISLWVSGGATGNVISKYTNLDATNSFFYFNRSNNGYQWVGNGTTPYINNTGVTDSDWTHYVLVGVAGTNNSKVYRNGVLIASGTLAMNSTMRAVSLLVGRVGASFPGYLNGKVDDIFIYNRALTASDVQNLYLAQPTVTWSNGASGNSILVAPTQTTTFYVDVSDGIGTCRDSVRVTVSNIGLFNPLADTTRICGTTTILNAGSGYASYSWNTGATTQNITPSVSGFYRVTVTNAAGCTAFDSTYLSLVSANIINRDTTICRGSSITLSIDSLFPRVVNQIHQNLFQATSNSWTNLRLLNYNNQSLAGNYLNDSLRFTASSLLFHDSILVTADLYLFDSWDGNCGGNQGPDYWGVHVNGGGLFRTTFSNYPIGSQTCSNLQAYPGQVGSSNPWGTGSDVRNLPAITWNAAISTKYSFSKALSHNSSSLSLSFFGNNLQSDESWGVDNVSISTIMNRPQVTWSTGASTNQITVSPTQTTTYYVTVSDGINTCTDSIIVAVSDIGSFNPLSDTLRVCGTSTVLNAGSGYTTYSWSNGSTSQSNTLTTSGFYRVTVTNASGCTASDSTYLSLVNANIINRDTTICRGSSITLSIDSLFPGRTACNISALPSNLRNGLVGYWPFCGNTNDASGNNNNGVVFGSPVLSSDRFNNPASSFRFFGNLNDYISISSFNLISGNQARSFSFWFKIPVDSDGGFALSYGAELNSGSGCDQGFHLEVNQSLSADCGFKGIGFGVNCRQRRHSIDLRDGRWHMYTLTYSGSGGFSGIKNYIDGVLINSTPCDQSGTSSFNTIPGSFGLTLGRRHDAPLFPNANLVAFDGFLDDIYAYNRELTVTEIQSMFSNAFTVTWSTGATSNQITVSPTQTTTYYVTVSDGVNICTDSVRVTVSDIGTFNPLSDTTRVCGISTVLNAGSGYTTYSWSNGSTSQSNTLTTGGFYRVTVSNADGCTATDSTLLSLVNARIINNDTTICRSTPITLSIDSLFPGRTTCTTAGLSANLRNGLVAYYPFCGNANDVSGNGFNGVINGATLAADRYSNLSSAYEFNGVNSWIQANITTLPLGNSPRTISFWAKQRALTSNGNQAGSVFHYGSTSQNNRFCCLYWPNIPTVIGENNDACYSCSESIPFTNISNIFNQWHFVSIAYDGSMVKCYVNGVLYFTALKNYSTVSSLFMIGRAVPGHWSGEYFNGFIDDLSIHNRELSSVEIQQLYGSNSNVVWSTGATTNQIIVNPTQTTTYYATVTDGITTCTDSVRITVAAVDTAVVVLDPLQVCTNGGQVRMQAGVASGYQWLRNGVAIPGATSRLYTASQTGSYRVALVNSAGCRDTSRTINVSLYPQPVSGFNINPNTQCFAGNQFSFTNTTTLSSGTITYLWDFGNGITSTQANPTYSFPATGTYIVKLVATSGTGCKDSTTRTITVSPSPTATFSVNTASQCVTGNQFSFTNNSSITTGTLTYVWSFGDGIVSTNANPTHSYINAGTYTVKLVVTSALGCKDSTTRTLNVYAKPTVDFSVNSLSQCVNENTFVFTNNTSITSGTITYIWRFGDGNSATTTNATHSYLAAGTYVVKLIAVSNNGCSDSTTQTVTVNPKPTADFSVNNAAQCLSTNQFVFNNLSTITSGALTHMWNFGNGASSIQTSPTYTYGNFGVYTVKLVSTSAAGCRDSITRSVTVHAMPTGTLNTPTTNFLCEGGIVSLSALGGTSYQWFINGGAIVGATSASYAANQPGTYTVNVISSNGCVAAATGAVTLQLVRKPTVNFTYDKYCAGFPTQFTDQSNTANSNTVTYSWSFGQGQGNSTQQNPSYTFPTASTYSVSLTVTPAACPSLVTSITKPVSIVAPPANKRYTSLNAVENRNLQLEARVFGGATYSWAPSSGLNSSTISNPIFNYNAEVDYVISITTGIGCIIRDTQLVRIFKEKEIYVPKGFSPNGDGNNDKIFPRLVGVRSLTYFKVFNRWGQLIFMTTNINEGWDGTYKGVKQPMEGYVWIAEGIDFDNNTIKRTGTFLLLR